jgi:hypothetical protein
MYHSFLLTAEMSSHLPRCTAPSNDLDTLDAIPWTHAHTDVLVNTGGVELQELWDDYGIVGDIVVSPCTLLSKSFYSLAILAAIYNVVPTGGHP